jgi:DNA repair protein RadC
MALAEISPLGSSADLVAALLTHGKPTACARAAATELLQAFGGLAGLAAAEANELEAAVIARRVGREKPPTMLVAALQLGLRLTTVDAPSPSRFTAAADVAAWAMPRIGRFRHEELWLLSLDGQSRLRAAVQVAKGGLHGVGTRSPDVLRAALRAAATGFVLIHNHPSGDPTPSLQDVTFTEQVHAAAVVVGVPLIDHVVVTASSFSSVPLPRGAP